MNCMPILSLYWKMNRIIFCDVYNRLAINIILYCIYTSWNKWIYYNKWVWWTKFIFWQKYAWKPTTWKPSALSKVLYLNMYFAAMTSAVIIFSAFQHKERIIPWRSLSTIFKVHECLKYLLLLFWRHDDMLYWVSCPHWRTKSNTLMSGNENDELRLSTKCTKLLNNSLSKAS